MGDLRAMSKALVVATIVVAGGASACDGSTAGETATSYGATGPRQVTSVVTQRGCKTSIARGRRSMEPALYREVKVGVMAFNDMQASHRRGRLTKPAREHAYWYDKYPTWLLKGERAVVSVAGSGARLLYTTGKLPSYSELASTVGFAACRDAAGKVVPTQFNGGIAVKKPGCVRITVRDEHGRVKTRRIRMGVTVCR